LLIGVVLMRGGADFSDRERSLLNLLRPYLSNAFRNAEARSMLNGFSALASEHGDGLILVSPLGVPLAANAPAFELAGAFGEHAPGTLPAPLLQWYRRSRAAEPLPPEPLVGHRGDDLVEARLLSSTLISLRQLRGSVDAEMLSGLGLSSRECEVLSLVSLGLTNRAIATRMGIEPGTVKKHLDNVFEKLGVHSRTAATAAALREGRRTHPHATQAFTDLLQ
jgi:DNA-binding CsgD family transcriptional regulator